MLRIKEVDTTGDWGNSALVSVDLVRSSTRS